jgi:hypothetical protein
VRVIGFQPSQFGGRIAQERRPVVFRQVGKLRAPQLDRSGGSGLQIMLIKKRGGVRRDVSLFLPHHPHAVVGLHRHTLDLRMLGQIDDLEQALAAGVPAFGTGALVAQPDRWPEAGRAVAPGGGKSAFFRFREHDPHAFSSRAASRS